MVGVLPLRGRQSQQEEEGVVAHRHFWWQVLEEVDSGALVEIFLWVFQQSELRFEVEMFKLVLMLSPVIVMKIA